MNTEPQALDASDIDRGAGISTEQQQQQPQGFRETALPMSEQSQAMVADLNALRQQAMDPALTYSERKVLIDKMSQLSRAAFLGAKTPAWHGDAKPDPRATDQSAYDPMADIFAGATDVLGESDKAALMKHAKVKGLPELQASVVGNFAQAAQLDKTTAKVVADRFAKHHDQGWGVGEPLTAEDRTNLHNECVRRFGSEEKAQSTAALARAYIAHVGLTELYNQHMGSLSYDPVILSMLALKAKQIGLGK